MHQVTDKAKQELKRWENELMELSEKAQKEVEETGKTIRQKYDERLHDLQQKVDETRDRLNSK